MKNTKEKKRGGRGPGLVLTLGLLVLLACAAFTGCTDAAEPGGEDTADYPVKLCYANAAYIAEGDEAIGRFMPAVEAAVKATPETVYTETLAALRETPEGDGYATMLKNNVKINGATLDEDGKMVTVDFDSQGLSGGSLEETFLVEQIVRTLCWSFDDVELVKFTIDGGPAETLMGHLDVTVPYALTATDGVPGSDTEAVMPLYE